MWMMEFLQRLKKSLRRGRTAELPSDDKEAFYTLMPMVVAHQHKSVSDLLSGSNFNVNFACGRSQRTLLHIAANCGTYECLSLLLKKGANPNAQDASGCTPLHLTARNGHRKCLNRLLESKADIHIHSKEGLTALHWLAVNGRAETLQDLLTHVTNVDIEDHQGQTALHIACQNGHITTLLCLLEHGASVNKKNHNGWTPLHFACSHGQHGAVEELLKRNAEVFFAEVGPNSLMEICVERGYGDTCQVLLQHHPKLFKHLMQLMQHCHVMRQDSLQRVFCHLCGVEQAMRERVVGGLAEQASLIGHRLLSGTQDLQQESECLLHCVRVLTELQYLPPQRRDSGSPSPLQSSSRPLSPLPAHSLQHLSTLWLLLENWLCLISQELQGQDAVTDGCQEIPNKVRNSSSAGALLQQPRSPQNAEELDAEERASSNDVIKDQQGKVANGGDHHCLTTGSSSPGMKECSAARADEEQGETKVSTTPDTQNKQLRNSGVAVGSDSQKSLHRDSAPTSGVQQDVAGNVVLDAIDRVCCVLQAMFLCSKLSLEGEEPIQFEDFIQKHLRVLQKLVQREPGLIFRHFHFVLDMPGLMASFLPIIKAQPFETRRKWFYDNLPSMPTDLVASRREAMEVQRDRLFHSSCEEILRRDPTMLMAELNVQFSGEEGVGHGVVREWFDTLSREILNPDYALFTQSADGRTFQPNSNSSVNPDHLSYFKFAGQILGLALYHRYLLNIYFTRSFYKHILGVPVNYTDVASIDPEYAKNLQWILDHSINELALDLTFSVETDVFGVMQEMELKQGGSKVAVNDDNKAEYVQMVTELRMTQAIRRQIDNFLSGFHDYIPRSLIRMFDEYELELLLSGLPEIDLKDWQSHTVYTGYSADSPVIQWFWSTVESMAEQTRVQLLQFVTGSSRVPYGGFSQLSSSGSTQLFTICKTSLQPRSLPTASTCINLLKLPEYRSEEELQERLMVALQCGSQGYGMV